MRESKLWASILALCGLYCGAFLMLDGSAIRAPLWAIAALGALLIFISIEDLRRLSFPLGSIIALAGICGVLAWYTSPTLWAHGLAAVIYGGLFVGVDRLLRKGPDTPALGLGDSLLIGCGGLLLGYTGPIQAILMASLGGLAWLCLGALLWKRPLRSPVPFGLFLSLGIWLTFLEPGLIGPL